MRPTPSSTAAVFPSATVSAIGLPNRTHELDRNLLAQVPSWQRSPSAILGGPKHVTTNSLLYYNKRSATAIATSLKEPI